MHGLTTACHSSSAARGISRTPVVPGMGVRGIARTPDAPGMGVRGIARTPVAHYRLQYARHNMHAFVLSAPQVERHSNINHSIDD